MGRGLQGLAAGKGQQSVDQGFGPFRRLAGVADQPLLALAADPAAREQIQRTQNGGEQIVEIMRHAAG
jgi:hypothetical protein